MGRFLLALLVVGCTNDYDSYKFEHSAAGGSTASGGAGSGGASSGGASSGGGGGNCESTYGSQDGVTNVCPASALGCELAFDSQVASCREICEAGGGQCVGAFNNAGECGHGQMLPCNTSTFNSAICVCSR